LRARSTYRLVPFRRRSGVDLAGKVAGELACRGAPLTHEGVGLTEEQEALDAIGDRCFDE
jgi:hypothetical protein